MANFSGISDVSGAIKIEGDKISTEFLHAQPQVGQATVNWNIPSPIEGCIQTSSINSAYCGIVVLASRIPLNGSNIPKDGKKYTADPTLDPDVHVGDRIGDALVIGAFYEGDKKAAGEDMTVSLVVNDYDPDDNYYVGVYAVTCTLEYHSDGIRAYSDILGDPETLDRPSVSAVMMNGEDGIKPTDGTNLEPGRIYSLEFDLNTNFPQDSKESNRISVSFDGEDASTYEDMMQVINDQLKNLDNPLRSSEPPHTGSNYWNAKTKELQRFNGYTYEVVPDVIVSDNDPSDTPEGSYWFDSTINQLKVRNANAIPATNLWDDIPTIVDTADPTNPDCGKIWFNGEKTYEWSGSTWCEIQTFLSEDNPSEMQTGICGEYWYNEESSILNRFNINTMEWVEKLAIYWPDAPDALPSGTLWFSTTERVLRTRIEFGSIQDWNLETKFVIGEVEPVKYAGLYWFRESTNEFFYLVGNKFELVDVLEWHEDPFSVTSCELWWDEKTDRLHEWDDVNLEWDVVNKLTTSSIDPLASKEIEEKAFWLDTVTNVLTEWDGSYFNPIVHYIDFPTDPTQIFSDSNVAWYNPIDNMVYVPSDVDGEWMLADPLIDSDFDPEFIPVGKVWFDTATDTLKMWTGIAWQEIPYTTQPIKIPVGELWLDITDNQLKSWDGKKWIPAESKVRGFIDTRGHIQFKTRARGSCVALLMLVPGYTWRGEQSSGYQVTFASGPMHNGGFKSVYTDNPFDIPRYIDSELRDDEFLFNALPARLQSVVIGSDTPNSTPAYSTIGLGTDGTPDERRKLAHDIRIQLGFPVVDVELSDEQIDHAITRTLGELRQRSDIAYRRGFYLLDIRPGSQNYLLTNKKIGFDSIVTVMGAFRRSGAFSGGYSSNSVFDQLFAQQLYGNSTAGGFDMTTLYLSQQYLELIEMMFATKLNFHFNEASRMLTFHQDFHKHERILLDTAIERTEQELFKDRWVKNWIERYTLGLSRFTLAEIRGKYAALPGAGGGVSLNAGELAAQGAADLQECDQQLEDFVASNVEQFGATDFVMG